MSNNDITETFIEMMVNKTISAITDKLEELDISLDYIAAALIDNASAQDISTRQKRRGRMRENAQTGEVSQISALRTAFGRQGFDVEANRGLIKWLAQMNYPADQVEKILADKRYAQESHPDRSWFGE